MIKQHQPEHYNQYLSLPDLAIFLFHGVIEFSTTGAANYTKKHIDKDYFAKIIKILTSTGVALKFSEVLEIYNNNESFPPNSFTITFDDGFKNNYIHAASILADYNCPATFYITTKFIDENYHSWIDQIEYAITKSKLNKLYLPWRESEYIFKNTVDQVSLLTEIRLEAKKNQNINRVELANDIISQLKVDLREMQGELYDKMNWNDVNELIKSNYFDIGGHTHSHAILSFCNQVDLNYEIKHCLELIYKNTGLMTTMFAYPDGQEIHYNQDVIDALKANRLLSCPTAIEGTNKALVSNEDPDFLFHLKRIMVT